MDGYFRRLNPRWKVVLGYALQELEGKRFLDLVHPDDQVSTLVALGELAARKVVLNFVNRYRCKDGSYRWIEWRSYPAGDLVYAAARDITERKRVEAELIAKREAEQKFSDQLTILAAITNELSKTQTLDELCRRSVEVGREKLGFDRIALWFVAEDHTTMLGTYGTDADGQTTDERLSRHLIDPASGLRLIADGNIALKVYKNAPLYQDGKQIGVGERLAVGLWNGETVIGFLSIDNFIHQQPFTDQDYELLRLYASALGHLWNLKYAQGNLAQLAETLKQRVAERTAQLEAANKELEAFAYSVSHDLRAPLRAVDGFSRILLGDCALQLPPEAAHYPERILANIQQMGRLIDDLLKFSRLSRQPLTKQRVELAEVVHQAIETLDSERKERQVEISIGELLPCQGDPTLLRQVWINLLTNALKFTRGQETAKIEVSCLTPEEGPPVYFVKDNGVGFDMQYVGKLFGVFQRLHSTEEFEGTGVGLATVQRIIHRHGGQVWAEAKVGAGATFYFTI